MCLQASFEASAKSNKTGMCSFLCLNLFKSESIIITIRFLLLVRTWLWHLTCFRFWGLWCCTAGHSGFPSQAGSHCIGSGWGRGFSFRLSSRLLLGFGFNAASLGRFRFGKCLHCSSSKGFLLGWCFRLGWFDSTLSRWIVFSGRSSNSPLRSPSQPRTSTSSWWTDRCPPALGPVRLCCGLCRRRGWTWWSWKAQGVNTLYLICHQLKTIHFLSSGIESAEGKSYMVLYTRALEISQHQKCKQIYQPCFDTQ